MVTENRMFQITIESDIRRFWRISLNKTVISVMRYHGNITERSLAEKHIPPLLPSPPPRPPLQKIVTEDLSMHPYSTYIVQTLFNLNTELSVECCNIMSEMKNSEPRLPSLIVFSHEAILHLSCQINRHKYVLWETEKLHKLSAATKGIHPN
jgi:hypothetical protein